MTKRWLRERRKDTYYKKAKELNYRSRAAFKLIQIHDRFNVVKQGDAVLDMGANPGGWSQVALELTGSEGTVIAVDLKHIEPIPGVEFIRGDARTDEVADEVREILAAKGKQSLDVIVSDMSPNISGNYDMDQARSVELCEAVLETAADLLRPGGRIVMKVFEGDMFIDLMEKVRGQFHNVRRHAPKASRASSSEIYIIAKGYRPQN